MLSPTLISSRRDPWNKGALVGQKAPLKLRDIWAIRVRLELIWPPTVSCAAAHLVQLHLRDVAHGDRIAARTIVMQQNRAAGAVRNHGADPKLGLRLDSARGTQDRGLSVSKPVTATPHSTPTRRSRVAASEREVQRVSQ